MTEKPADAQKAYRNRAFLDGADARSLRILSEYLEPESRFDHYDIKDTIVFMGSARTPSRDEAEAALAEARDQGGDVAAAEKQVEMSAYYEAARDLAGRLTEWSKGLGENARRFVICTGGGPGIMEAGNRGASEAKGLNVGLTISLPFEEEENPWISRELDFRFHYFFMRKFWFTYLAKAVVFFPGGFGTLDELFEILTLVQTQKLKKRMPLVLFGSSFWDKVVNMDAMVEAGTISPGDVDLVHRTDSVDDAFDFLVHELTEHAMAEPGAHL
jgi:uncharacterized protein (TIGR00730 family)